MLKMFFSLSSDILFIAILKNDKHLVSIKKENKRQHSENFFFYLKGVLKKSKTSLKNLEEIYFTSAPGGQTGLRISLAFIATLQVLNPLISFYHLNSLLFQAGSKKTISLLSIDSKKSKYHLAVYQEKKCLKEVQIATREQAEILKKQFTDFSVLNDFLEIDFLQNFQQLKENFNKVKSLSEIV